MPRGEPILEDLENLILDSSRPDQVLKISNQLNSEDKKELSQCLRANSYVFSWCHDDMKGLNLEVMIHMLNADPTFKPVRQKKRNFSTERN